METQMSEKRSYVKTAVASVRARAVDRGRLGAGKLEAGTSVYWNTTRRLPARAPGLSLHQSPMKTAFASLALGALLNTGWALAASKPPPISANCRNIETGWIITEEAYPNHTDSVKNESS